jgi:hypothetical protein
MITQMETMARKMQEGEQRMAQIENNLEELMSAFEQLASQIAGAAAPQ